MLIQAVLSSGIFISRLFFKGGVILCFNLRNSRYCMHVFLSVLCCIACHGVMGLEPAIENK